MSLQIKCAIVLFNISVYFLYYSTPQNDMHHHQNPYQKRHILITVQFNKLWNRKHLNSGQINPISSKALIHGRPLLSRRVQYSGAQDDSYSCQDSLDPGICNLCVKYPFQEIMAKSGRNLSAQWWTLPVYMYIINRGQWVHSSWVHGVQKGSTSTWTRSTKVDVHLMALSTRWQTGTFGVRYWHSPHRTKTWINGKRPQKWNLPPTPSHDLFCYPWLNLHSVHRFHDNKNLMLLWLFGPYKHLPCGMKDSMATLSILLFCYQWDPRVLIYRHSSTWRS